jgi:hypothetical protein
VSKVVRSVTRAVQSVVNVHQRYIDWNVRAVQKARDNPYVRTAVAAVAAYYTWGYTAWGTGSYVAAGAASGAVGGGIVTGNTKGALYGGATGGAFGYVQGLGETYNWSSPTRITANATTGGITTQAQGGDFRTGFIYEGASATASWGYQKVVGIGATPESGKGLARSDGTYPPDLETGRPPYGYNVFGNNEPLTGSFFGDFFKQGGALSVVANQFPGANAVAYFHDTWMNQLGSSFNAFTNYSTMPAAAALGYGALLDGPLSVQLA